MLTASFVSDEGLFWRFSYLAETPCPVLVVAESVVLVLLDSLSSAVIRRGGVVSCTGRLTIIRFSGMQSAVLNDRNEMRKHE